MKADIGYWWFCVKLWFRERPEKIAWWFAWKLPRRIALMAFVRVCSATGDGPSDVTYESAYKAWERGAGR
jgi:hypothetical protein